MKVLIAEDDVGTSYTLSRLLGAWGFAPFAVAHAADARAILDGPAPPPLAVVEHELAGGSAVELCRHIRGRGQHGHEGGRQGDGHRDGYTYVLVIGAIVDLEATYALVDAGANDFLGKPFAIEELRRRMDSGRRLVEAVAAGRARVPLQPDHRPTRARPTLQAAPGRSTPRRPVLTPAGLAWKWDV
jgi:DNA-binding response OmpR family regulator